MNTTKNKVALVTGGGRGIGLGISQHLARSGFNLMISGIRPLEAVQEAMESLRALGVKAEYCQADVSEAAARQRLIEETRGQFGALHLLVNNAGVAPTQRSDILEASEESFERLMRVNLQGPYFLTQLAARWMVEQKKSAGDFSGAIINISSVSAIVASVNRGDYCLTKAGVAMATKLWAARLGEFGIAVYEIRPGVIKTDMTAGVGEKYDKLIAEGLLVEPRWGVPDDIGRAAAALARGEIPYATGQVLTVDGGLTLQRL